MPAIQPTPLKDPVTITRNLISSSTSSLFTSALTKRPVPVQPVSDTMVCDNGAFWFFTDCIMRDLSSGAHRTQLFYANSADMIFLSVSGSAEVITDTGLRSRREDELTLKPGTDKGFSSLHLLKVTPASGFYWDARIGKMTSLSFDQLKEQVC